MANKIGWFKLLWLNSEERAALKRGMEQPESQPVTPVESLPEKEDYTPKKLYSKIIYSNRIVTVVFADGVTLSKENQEVDIIQRIKDATTEGEIYQILSSVAPIIPDPEEDETVTNERKLVNDNLGILRTNIDFIVTGSDVFLKGVNLALPYIVTSSFIEILEKMHASEHPLDYDELYEQFVALKMFWLKLALNTLEQSRQDLLAFVRHNDVRITPNGNLVLYRRIVTTGQKDKKLTKFVSQMYYKVKKAKKGPGNYYVIKTVGKKDSVKYIITNKIQTNGDNVVGNLKDMYNNLENLKENTYTSAHNSGLHTIRIGSIYKINDNLINLDNGLCAAGGLHAAAVDYDYSGFGDTAVVVLVNPSKAITVPIDEMGKLRTVEMFVACINDNPIGTHFDDDALSAFDEEYHDHTIEELEEVVSKKDFTSLTVEDTQPVQTIAEIKTIKEMLAQRVQAIA